MLGPLGGPELAIIAVVIILTSALASQQLGKDLGSSIKEFRRAVKDDEPDRRTSSRPARRRHRPIRPGRAAVPAAPVQRQDERF